MISTRHNTRIQIRKVAHVHSVGYVYGTCASTVHIPTGCVGVTDHPKCKLKENKCLIHVFSFVI